MRAYHPQLGDPLQVLIDSLMHVQEMDRGTFITRLEPLRSGTPEDDSNRVLKCCYDPLPLEKISTAGPEELYDSRNARARPEA